MDELEARIVELLEQTPGSRLLAVAATPKRRQEIAQHFRNAHVVVVTPGAAVYGECYDAVVIEVAAEDWRTPWFDEVLPTRLKPYAGTHLVRADA